MSSTQYVILHQSAAKLPGVAAVQAAHAATEALTSVPVPSDTFVCVLRAETSQEIEDISRELLEVGVHNVVIREPDPPYHGAACAIGTEILLDREKVRPILGRLKVLR